MVKDQLGKPRTFGGGATRRFLYCVLASAARASPGFPVRTGRIEHGPTGDR